MDGLFIFLIGWATWQIFLYIVLLKFISKYKNELDNNWLPHNTYLERIPPDFITWSRLH